MAKKTVEKAEKAGKVAKVKQPRSVPLKGMEHVRYARLDALCEAIGDDREQKNALIGHEKGNLQAAMVEMRSKKLDVYAFGGVELIRVPGDEKMRVHLTNGQSADRAKAADGDGAEADEDGVPL